ncbi:MAG: hypothetical protein J1F14_08360 [Treponema sp.]|nr:hypothetical protein [Treponema sp.]
MILPRLKKNVAFAAILFFSLLTLPAQNGISVDVLQGDPYFMNGDVDYALKENPASDIKRGNVSAAPLRYRQMDDPSDSETFYNAQNWHDFPEDEEEVRKKKPGPATGDTPLYNPVYTYFTPWQESKFTAGLFYSPLYAPGFMTTAGLEEPLPLDNADGLSFLGGMLSMAYFTSRGRHVKTGVELSGSYNFLHSRKDQYTLSASLIGLDLAFFWCFFVTERLSLDLALGGGRLFFFDAKITYADDSPSVACDWTFPDVMGAVGLEFYFNRSVGIHARVQFTWPFTTYLDSPLLHIGVGAGVRLWNSPFKES